MTIATNQPPTMRVATYGVTVRAAKAVIDAGGIVVFESCPGAPAFFSNQLPVLYPPTGTVKIERPGRGSPCGFVLPTGERIVADCQSLHYQLKSGPTAENGPQGNGAGDWGTNLTQNALIGLSRR